MLGLVDSVVGVAGKVLDKFVEDKDLKTKLNAELKSQMIALDLAQAQANIEQAKHPSIFVSGARPAIMWICAFALGWQYILAPIASWVIVVWYPMVTLPTLQTEELTGLIMALLGLGGMRTAEKWKGVSRENMKRSP
ncbi:MAG: 3TM-type holin [Gammaproteobacteria bacterium]